MAAPVIQSTTDIAETGTTFNVTLPSGTVAGDLLLAIIAKDDDIDMNSSHGMTEYPYVGGDYSSYVFYKIAVAADITRTYMTFTGDNEGYVGRMYRITGFDSGTPIDAIDATGQTGTSAAPQAASINTVTNDALVFAWAGMDDNDVPYSLDTAGWTTDHNTSVTTAGIVIGYKVQATLGATGAVDFTTNASDGWAASQVAIRPAAGGEEWSSSESITVADSPTATSASGISATESVSVEDSPTIETVGPNYSISESESITVADSPAWAIGEVANLTIDEAETITVADSPAIEFDMVFSASEAVTVTDAPTASVTGAAVAVDESESISITDSPSIDLSLGNYSIDESETISIIDSPSLNMSGGYSISEAETFTVTDEASICVFDTCHQALLNKIIKLEKKLVLHEAIYHY